MLNSFKKTNAENIFSSTDKYVVSDIGQVFEVVDGVTRELVSESEYFTFSLDGYSVKLHIDAIMCCGFKKIYNSDKFIQEWSVLYMDGNPGNRTIGNMMLIPPSGGQQCPDSPDCKIIPFTGRFSVSEDGQKVWDRINKCVYVPNKNNAGYLNISVGGHNGERYKMGLHKAVMWAHESITPTTLKMIPNHKDGNKQNCAKYNLQYSTYSENNKHAVQTRLRDVRRGVDVLDLIDNTVRTFDTLGDAATFFEMNSGYLHDIIRKTPLIPYQDRYAIKYSDSPYEFPEYKPQKLAEWKRKRDTALQSRMCYAVDIFTGERIIADNPYALGKMLGLTGDQIKIAFRFEGGKENTRIPRLWPYLNYEFRWVNGKIQRKHRKYTADELLAFKDKTIITKPLRVTWNNGETKVYCNLFQLSKEIKSPARPILAQKLQDGAGKYIFDDFSVEYLIY